MPELSSVIKGAIDIATAAHIKQSRKWTKEPYVTHPRRVADRISHYFTPGTTDYDTVVAAAWLHDVLEDTDFPAEELVRRCSIDVFHLVWELTNPSKKLKGLPRATRKAVDRFHLARTSKHAKMLKLADRIDNLNDLQGSETDFRKLYAEESAELLKVLEGTHPELEAELRNVIEKIRASV